MCYGVAKMRNACDRFSLNVPAELGALIRKMASDRDMHVSQMVRAGIDHWVTMNAHRIDPEVYQRYLRMRKLSRD